MSDRETFENQAAYEAGYEAGALQLEELAEMDRLRQTNLALMDVLRDLLVVHGYYYCGPDRDFTLRKSEVNERAAKVLAAAKALFPKDKT